MYRRGLDVIIPKSEVYDACYLRDLEKLKIAIKKPGGVEDAKNFIDPITNKTCLFVASEDACPDCAEVLLKNGADINAVGPRMRSPLIAAASFKRLELIELLCKNGADVNQQDDEGQSALFFACFASSIPCMRALHKAGANLNLRDVHRNTVLMRAVDYRDGRAIDWLLRKNADPTLLDVNKKSALQHAKDRKFKELVKKLDGSDTVDEDLFDEKEEHLLFLAAQRAEAEREEMEAARELAERQAKMEAEGPWGGHVKQEEVDASWLELTDETTGMPYWFNELTNETVYVRPKCIPEPKEIVPVEVIEFTEEMHYTVGSAKKAIYQSLLQSGEWTDDDLRDFLLPKEHHDKLDNIWEHWEAPPHSEQFIVDQNKYTFTIKFDDDEEESGVEVRMLRSIKQREYGDEEFVVGDRIKAKLDDWEEFYTGTILEITKKDEFNEDKEDEEYEKMLEKKRKKKNKKRKKKKKKKKKKKDSDDDSSNSDDDSSEDDSSDSS